MRGKQDRSSAVGKGEWARYGMAWKDGWVTLNKNESKEERRWEMTLCTTKSLRDAEVAAKDALILCRD